MTKTFTHEGNEFKIEVGLDGEDHKVKVYHNDIEISSYFVTVETAIDHKISHPTNPSMIDELITLAQDDIKKWYYQDILDICYKNQNRLRRIVCIGV